jgi:hypothetical protein
MMVTLRSINTQIIYIVEHRSLVADTLNYNESNVGYEFLMVRECVSSEVKVKLSL